MAGAFNAGFSNGFDLDSISILTLSIDNIIYNIPYSGELLSSDAGDWTVSSGTLPTGITLNASGILSGTSTDVGTHYVVIKVTDPLNLHIDEKEFNVFVTILSSWRFVNSMNNFRLIRRI